MGPDTKVVAEIGAPKPPMSPERLRALNISHFQRLLARTSDPEKRRMIERLIEEEATRPDSDYPAAWSPADKRD